ncbi:MAG: glycogen/starch/alpha-glucan phosphorylase [Eubacteriales bacterium]|nr:glycogen/starch/alpha-glucan phosphorylase [Eubacteriales bacterium]MDD3199879.1 glycogen/starch/alpha-glucan phosphorylase [Eubacteriales bacterium]MDD4630271.1 glycogen/starch/alpha-glucan phosphorylase [Eubacteriales bacterium]
MDKVYTTGKISKLIDGKLMRHFGREPDNATKQQLYRAACFVVRDILSEKWLKNHEIVCSQTEKQVIYLSMEFLPGTSLKNNLFNLGLEDVFKETLAEYDQDMEELYMLEPDAGLGNGGLGRLASCYLDAVSSCNMFGQGMSICYEYGIFKQKIQDGRQIEKPDDWLDLGDCWLITKEDEAEEVHFGGKLSEVWDDKGRMKLIHEDYLSVIAVPKDMLISGYQSDVVNTLRLWKSTSPISIDMELFAKGEYLHSMEEKHQAEIISKILYPEDAHDEGKILRMKQQYFFTSASMQSLTKRHMQSYNSLDNFHEKIAVHINDTHPTMAILELMRIFMDIYDYKWDKAWDIVSKTISYTNHTVMPEALEQWPESLFSGLLPRLHSILKEINRRFDEILAAAYPNDEQLRNEMAIIHNGKIRMANLCVVTAHTVNGVSSLHSRIIKNKLFRGFSAMTPNKFTNVTNGIAYRRWLCQANPNLSDLIEELCGPGFKKNSNKLEKLMKYREDSSVLERFANVKRENKIKLADYIKNHNNIIVDPDSIFDVQVKRLHEYKRQLLNLVHIIDLYHRIKENPNLELQPRTFIFGAKAAAGYYMAKQIILLACKLSEHLEKDPHVRDRIKVVFLENYSVSLSELIMPAADLSEQISLAGKEASGTGNMKLMLNGAVTIGTMDGANVEIYNAVGNDNIFIFGMTAEQVEQLRISGTYSPWSYYQDNRNISEIIRFLAGGIHGVSFSDIINSLTTGFNGEADQYYVIADFESYKTAQSAAATTYQDAFRWGGMSLTNIAKAGAFSADRSVREYADRIWGIQPLYD